MYIPNGSRTKSTKSTELKMLKKVEEGWIVGGFQSVEGLVRSHRTEPYRRRDRLFV